MKSNTYHIRQARPEEFERVGVLMVRVYTQLKGFPSPEEFPEYYKKLAEVGLLTQDPGVELLVAINEQQEIHGAVVYIGDMRYYGAQNIAKNESQASGFRLLAVDTKARGQGLGKRLIQICIDQARVENKEAMIIHSTKSMALAWTMYEKLGFKRATVFDFKQDQLEVFGFRLRIDE